MLVHICCSVDSHFFLQKLQAHYPQERLIGFFYNPNIHPVSEYLLRLSDVQRSCDKLDIELIVGEYDYENWLGDIKGFEQEHEKGKRCDICFYKRLQISAKQAQKMGERSLTTTLFMSPKKSFNQLSFISKKIEKEFKIEIVTPDFRSNNGTQEQFLLAKKEMLYHQNYCGCMFALTKQREVQKKTTDELMSPIGKEILPNSIEEKIELYKSIVWYEKQQKKFRIERRRFLNYRLLTGLVKFENMPISSYFLFYSTFKKEYLKVNIIDDKDDFIYKNEIVFLSLKKFNLLANTNYKSVKELIFNPINIKTSLHVRILIDENPFSLLPIVVVDEVKSGKYEIACKTTNYQDVREVLVSV